MQYVTVIDGQTQHVDITHNGDDRFVLQIGPERVEVSEQTIDAHGLSVVAADREAFHAELSFAAAGADDVAGVAVYGFELEAAVYTLRSHALRQAQHSIGSVAAPAALVSPMPGRVVAVLVQEGQQVSQGQGLVVIEAMKMENELRAPKAGTVRHLQAQVGDAIDGGATLCVVE